MFKKTEWVSFAIETVENDEVPYKVAETLDYEAFGDLMEKVHAHNGTIDSGLWHGDNPCGTEDRLWVRVWAYLAHSVADYRAYLSPSHPDGYQINYILKEFNKQRSIAVMAE